MIEMSKAEECCGCSACVQICPSQCIDMVEDSEGFLYPHVDSSRCIHCHLCEKICPFKVESASRIPLHAYAVRHYDESVLLQSSSGGAFSLLAEYILSKEGVVYGVCFDNDHTKVSHRRIVEIKDMPLLRTSKYLQSDINGTYKKVKEDLIHERLVLFSGTPCQIMGLRMYLGKEYDSLYTVDLLCHGVPSPKIWREYLHSLISSTKLDKECVLYPVVKDITFRNKDEGWKKFKIKAVMDSEHESFQYSSGFNKDPYMQLFLNNVILRPSCYKCKMKEGKSHSDITIGDFWQINRIDPNIDDDKGISLVLANSGKGEFLVHESSGIIKKFQVSDVIQDNSAWKQSADMHEMRKYFFLHYRKMNNLGEIAHYIFHPSLVIRIIRKIYRIMGVNQIPI